MTGGFIFPKVYVSNIICKGSTITEVYVTVLFTGEIIFRISADNGANWENISLTTDTRIKHTFTNTGTELLFMAIGNPDAKISTAKYNTGQFQTPGIKIEITGIS